MTNTHIQTTVEEIDGRKYTVVRKPFHAQWVTQEMRAGRPVKYEASPENGGGYGVLCGYNPECHMDEGFIIETLDPLPRHPENNEATIRLIAAYRAQGIEVWNNHNKASETLNFCNGVTPITHATYAQTGEPVDIAIEEAE